MMEWQPIETAPKSEKCIDGWYDGQRITDIWWGVDYQTREECWVAYRYEDCYGWVPRCAGEPTHWMPLPPPPQGA